MFVSTFFVEMNKTTTIFVLNNILFGSCAYVYSCNFLYLQFYCSQVARHNDFQLIFVNMLKQLFKDTRHHANILLVVTKSQNCKSYLLPPNPIPIPIWILAFAVKLAGAIKIVAIIYKKNFKPFPK